MKQLRISLVFVVIALLVLAVAVGAAFAGSQSNFTASLKARNENPSNDSSGQGQAIFHLSKDETELSFKLIVANIEDVTQAHIHCGAADVNGPVVLFLFGFDPDGVNVNGVLSEGTATNADVIPRPDSGACPGGLANFDELIAKMRSGDAYVNVHTLDLPAGEIRGQIK